MLGNGIFQTLLVILNAAFVTWLTNNYHRILDAMNLDMLGHFFLNGKRIILESAIISTRHYVTCHMSKESKAILYFLHKNLHLFKDVKQVEIIDYMSSMDDERKTFMIPIQNQWIAIPRGNNNNDFDKDKDKDIKIRVQRNKNIHDGNGFDSRAVYLNLTCEIYSDTLQSSDLQNFVEQCTHEFELYLRNKNLPQSCFIFQSCTEENNEVIFKVVPFETNKNESNVVFDGVEDVIERVKFFESEKGRVHYERIGIPWTFGMLFAGESGTGKTSMIKTIAKLTGRHIVVVRMDIILKKYYDKSIDILRDIFFNEELGDIHVPQSKRLYVFEEADTWHDLMSRRGKITNKEKPSSGRKPESSSLETLLEAAISKDDNSNGEHVLGGILELLDGIIETPGRMCIMTTNHPERLDPALVRRFNDVNHVFQRLSSKHVEKIYKQWFTRELPDWVKVNVADREWTQAQLCQLFLSPNHDVVLSTLAHSHSVHSHPVHPHLVHPHLVHSPCPFPSPSSS